MHTPPVTIALENTKHKLKQKLFMSPDAEKFTTKKEERKKKVKRVTSANLFNAKLFMFRERKARRKMINDENLALVKKGRETVGKNSYRAEQE